MIHHYTSIKTLSLILRHRKFKFTRSDLVNDPLDGFSSTFRDSRKLSFISCFTRKNNDTIPMWAMYTNNLEGIRISFPEDLFGKVEQNRFDFRIRKLKQNPLEQESPFLAGPEDIIYKDSIDEIDHEIISPIENHNVRPIKLGKKFNPWKIGKFKLRDWEFEEECRFIVPAIDYMFGAGNESFKAKIEEVFGKLGALPEAVFIDFNEEVLKKTEILLGPRTDDADLLIVEALVNSYTPGIKSIKKTDIKVV